MIKLLGKLPKSITVALSGGVDSVALLHFLSKKHEVNAAFFNHGTENCDISQKFVIDLCKKMTIKLTVGSILEVKPKELSVEEHWRNQRYEFLSKFENVVTGHNLDDCVETWIWSSLHGTPKLIPYSRNNVTRPLLCTPKKSLMEWCSHNNLSWCEDISNLDQNYTRNYIRHNMISHALKVNPGLYKTIRKKIEQKFAINSR